MFQNSAPYVQRCLFTHGESESKSKSEWLGNAYCRDHTDTFSQPHLHGLKGLWAEQESEDCDFGKAHLIPTGLSQRAIYVTIESIIREGGRLGQPLAIVSVNSTVMIGPRVSMISPTSGLVKHLHTHWSAGTGKNPRINQLCFTASQTSSHMLVHHTFLHRSNLMQSLAYRVSMGPKFGGS